MKSTLWQTKYQGNLTLQALPLAFRNACAMSGVKYLLDTNFILGMLKAVPEISKILAIQQITANECAYSAVTRMELLGFQGIKTS
jgi:hypothetical protein